MAFAGATVGRGKGVREAVPGSSPGTGLSALSRVKEKGLSRLSDYQMCAPYCYVTFFNGYVAFFDVFLTSNV